MTIDVTKYEPVITKILSRLKAKRDQKEDLIQECYLALLERQSELGGSDDLDKAATICRTRAKEVRRARNQHDVKKENRIKHVSADDPNIARQLAKIAARDEGEISELELHEAISALDVKEQTVINALFVDGLTRQKAAEKLGLTEDAVRWGKKKGIEALKKYFEVETWA